MSLYIPARKSNGGIVCAYSINIRVVTCMLFLLKTLHSRYKHILY